ncbi:MAG: FtsX-like permease family protein [Bacillota bacterium]
MWGSLLRLAFRFPQKRLGRSLLVVVGVALGTALLTALLTLNESMERNLDEQLTRKYGSFDMVAGYRDHSRYLTASDLRLIRTTPGVREVAVSLEANRGPVAPGSLLVKGIAVHHLYTELYPLLEGRWPSAGEVVLSDAAASQLSVGVGDEVLLPGSAGGLMARVSGVYEQPPDLPVSTAFVEVEWLRQALNVPGYHSVRLDLAPDANLLDARLTLQARIPGIDVLVRTKLSEMRGALHALQPISQTLGLVALFMAGFLVASAFTFALHERTTELAVLRSIGASRSQLSALILVEAGVLGAVGALLGLGIGSGLAFAANEGVGEWLGVAVSTVYFPWSLLSWIWVGGVAISLIFAMRAAIKAGSIPPAIVFRPTVQAVSRQRERITGGIGLCLTGLGAAMFLLRWVLPSGGEWIDLRSQAGAGGAIFFAAGLTIGLPYLLGGLVPAAARLLRICFPMEALLAARFVLRHRGRSTATAVALSLGLVLLIATSLWRETFDGRDEAAVLAAHPTDAVLSVPVVYQEAVDGDLVRQVRQTPGVQMVGGLGPGKAAFMPDHDWTGADPALLTWWQTLNIDPYQIPYAEADVVELGQMGVLRVIQGEVVAGGAVITETFARLYGIQPGDWLDLQDPEPLNGTGSNPLRVTAIVATPPGFDNLLVPPRSAEGLKKVRSIYVNGSTKSLQQVQDLISDDSRYELVTYSNVALAREKTRRELNQRLAIVYAVVLVIGLIACLSLISSQVAGLHERQQEFGTLLAMGGSQAQLARIIVCEGVILGMSGSVVGVIGGGLVGAGVMYALEVPAVTIPWISIGVGMVGGIVTPGVASWFPASRARQLTVRDLIQWAG